VVTGRLAGVGFIADETPAVVAAATVRRPSHSTSPTFQFFAIRRRSNRATGTSGLAEVEQGLRCGGPFNQFTKNTGSKGCDEVQVTQVGLAPVSNSKDILKGKLGVHILGLIRKMSGIV